MEPAFKQINKLASRLHDEWIGRFCIGDKRCPRSELKFADGWPIKRTFCKTTGLDVMFMDVERLCPRRDELTERRHAENVARKKAKAQARRDFDAAHPREKEPVARFPAQDASTLIEGLPESAPEDFGDLF